MQTGRHVDRQADRQTNRHRDRQADGQAYRHADRHTDRQAEKTIMRTDSDEDGENDITPESYMHVSG